MSRTTIALWIATLATVLLAGCGSTTHQSPAESRAQVQAAAGQLATAICFEENRKDCAIRALTRIGPTVWRERVEWDDGRFLCAIFDTTRFHVHMNAHLDPTFEGAAADYCERLPSP